MNTVAEVPKCKGRKEGVTNFLSRKQIFAKCYLMGKYSLIAWKHNDEQGRYSHASLEGHNFYQLFSSISQCFSKSALSPKHSRH